MDEYGQRLRDTVGPYNEGAHLTVICEAEGGKPRPNIWWLKNNDLLDDSWTITPQGIIRNELVITRLVRSDHRSTLTCQATNSNLTRPVSTTITLELNLRPLDVRITTLHRPILADHKIEVVCESVGSRPAALVTWWKGSKRMVHTVEEICKNENCTKSIVHFIPSIEDNGKILSCRADHAILPDSALEDSWILDVYYTPKLTVSLGASIHHDQVREGSNVSFECHIMANPPVSEIGWKYEHKILTNNQNILLKGNSLILTNVMRKNSGKYRCVAANAEGEEESEDIDLKILYAPTCKLDQRTIYGVAKREPIRVPCDVEADPTQVTFRWTFNNSYEVVPVKNFVSAKTRSIATYSPRSKYGYGELYCWAKNKVGEQSEPCVFSVIPAGPPQPVRNCLVGNQSTEALVVKCEHGEDGGLEQTFHLEIYRSEDGRIQSNWTFIKAPLFEVSGLPIATSFVLVLYAANPKGRSNYVTLTATTLPFPNSSSEIGIKPVIYLLIAVIGSLVIAATAIMIISKLRSIDQNKGCQRNTFHNCGINSTRSSEDINSDNARHCSNQNGNLTSIQMGTLYVKTLDAIEVTNANDINESWDQQMNEEKYRNISNHNNIDVNESHVTLSLEHRITPEGDAFAERSASDSTSTMSSSHPQDYKRINRYLMPPPSILRDGSVLITDDETITCETPLMNGIYYTSFTNNSHRPTQQKHVTPLSTPV